MKTRKIKRHLKKLAGLPIILLLAGVISLQNAYTQNKLTDKEISNAVNDELLFSSTTPSYLIDIETNEGIVTLDGKVNSLLASENAVKIAQSVKGVRGVINQIEINDVMISDSELRDDIEKALLLDPATESYEVNTSVANSKVTLTGKVNSWQEKQLVSDVVKGVKGVKAVENKVDINYKTDRIDYEIENEIVEALRNDIRIDDGLIDVKVKNGDVKLSGVVGSAFEKNQAKAKAWVAGVKSVKTDNLEVKEWARDEKLREEKYVYKTDAELREAVKDVFLYDPRIYSFNPEITVSNGIVTLSGVVDNLKAKRAAEDDASNVVGVFSVRNYLQVRPASIPEDVVLENNIEDAILRDPYVERYEIDVLANNGMVYLTGSVDTYFEKIHAEDVVARTKGVVNVKNNIRVDDTDSYIHPGYYGWYNYYPGNYISVERTYSTDWEIHTNIVNQLWWSPYVNEDEVNVVVENGVAQLTGTVDTQREKLFAEINAVEGGAIEVDNDLKVDYSPK